MNSAHCPWPAANLLSVLAHTDLAAKPADGVVLHVGDALLEGNQRIVGDVNVLRADLSAALGDVAVAQPELLLGHLLAIHRVQWVHVELGDAHQHARSSEGFVVLLVIAHHVAGVLAQEALNALAELLAALNILLLHPELTWLQANGRGEGGNFARLLVVEGDIGDEVTNHWEGTKWGDGDRLLFFEGVHARHAHQAWLAIDLCAA